MERKDATDTFTTRADESGAVTLNVATTSRAGNSHQRLVVRLGWHSRERRSEANAVRSSHAVQQRTTMTKDVIAETRFGHNRLTCHNCNDCLLLGSMSRLLADSDRELDTLHPLAASATGA